jgi:hypothetical protein
MAADGERDRCGALVFMAVGYRVRHEEYDAPAGRLVEW